MGESGTRLEAKQAQNELLPKESVETAVQAYNDWWSAGLAVLRNQVHVCNELIEMSQKGNERMKLEAIRLLIPLAKEFGERVMTMRQKGSLENVLGGFDAKTIVLLKELVEAVSRNSTVLDAATASDSSS